MTSLRAVEQLLDIPGCLTPVLRGFRIDASAMIAQALDTSPTILAKWLPAVPVESCMSGSLFSLRALLPLEPHFSKLHLVRGRTPLQFRSAAQGRLSALLQLLSKQGAAAGEQTQPLAAARGRPDRGTSSELSWRDHRQCGLLQQKLGLSDLVVLQFAWSSDVL